MKKRYFISFTVFFALLSYSYYYFFYFIQNFDNKIGFPLDLNFIKLIESLILLSIISIFYVAYDINNSVYLTFSYILYVFILIPMGVFYWMSNSTRVYFYMYFVAFLLLNVMFVIFREKLQDPLLKIPERLNLSKPKDNNENKRAKIINAVFLSIILVFIIVDIYIYKKYGHSIYYLFNLNEVYNIRHEAREAVPSSMNYIISWSALVIIPSCIAWCVKSKKYILMIVPIFIQVLLFTVGGAKSHLFGLALAIFIFILFKYKFMNYFMRFLNFVLAASLIINNKFIMAVVIRRAFFVPASTSYAYYLFFSKNAKIKLSNSILSSIFENPYKLDPSFIISRYIFREPNMSSNVNFIGNAYANFGFLGIVLFAIILGLVFWAIEYVSLNSKYKEYIILITFSSVFALNNAALLTTLKNHGLLLSIVMSFLFIKSIKEYKNLRT